MGRNSGKRVKMVRWIERMEEEKMVRLRSVTTYSMEAHWNWLV